MDFRFVLDDLYAILLIVLTPFASLCLFAIASVIALALYKKRNIHFAFRITLTSATVFGIYTIFNVIDYVGYRSTGLSISPINRFCFRFFLAPPDLYEPYISIPFPSCPQIHKLKYKHRYGGSQSIVFNLVNETPDKFRYVDETELGIEFRGEIRCAGRGVRFAFEKKFEKKHLLQGTNYLFLCGYDVLSRDELSEEYEASIEISGAVENVKAKFPNSIVSICNGTSE